MLDVKEDTPSGAAAPVGTPCPASMSSADQDEAALLEADLVATGRSALKLALSLGRTAEEAADVVQEAALRAWRYRKSRRGDWKPWFLTIVYRTARRRGWRWLTLPAVWTPDGEWPADSSTEPDLAQALRRLPPRQRTALWLRYGEDMTVRDVAEVIGIRETAAKQLLSRGRSALRRMLAPATKEVGYGTSE